MGEKETSGLRGRGRAIYVESRSEITRGDTTLKPQRNCPMRGGGLGRLGHFLDESIGRVCPSGAARLLRRISMRPASQLDRRSRPPRSLVSAYGNARAPMAWSIWPWIRFHATLAKSILATSFGLMEMRRAAREMVGRLTPGQPASAPARIVRRGKSLKGK